MLSSPSLMGSLLGLCAVRRLSMSVDMLLSGKIKVGTILLKKGLNHMV